MNIPLPPWLTMGDDPGATHVTVFRGIPNDPKHAGARPGSEYHGRAATLRQQALDAIHDHTQNAFEPTPDQLDAIAEFPAKRSPLLFLCRAHGSPRVDRRPSCPLESRRPRSEDARSLSTHHSILLRSEAFAPCATAVRC